MRKIIYLLSILTIGVQISGCSQNIVVPGAETLTNETSAYIKLDNNWSWSVSTTIDAVYPSEGKALLEAKPFIEYSQIKVTPGIYRVVLRVVSGHARAFPALRVVAKPGKTYILTSKPVMDGAAVKAEYKEINTIE
ncbi:hypothetical protein [Pseudomonas alvandae]|jgi:hypothetical protein|uniref:Lipoprotein n=1 Tax=Pseudomonas canavaninivorans TaxID=2842348 RepID=A0ABX8Q8D0_PSECO|nr:hypothetical protein [Pseudomonas alvandae]QXI51413.1 hypothetical protein KSS97_17900 [Pseudomonas alvandae]